MEEEIYALHRLLDRDTRYPLEAYIFVREGLAYASNVLNLGNETVAEEPDLQLELDATQEDLTPHKERHLTGQELCDAIRVYAINEFGYMARLVLEKWGITQTQDFGNIVYNMIEVGLMKKSTNDCREHFDDVYDFANAFERDYELKISGS
ncbi:MAG: hypothetical protein P8J33_11205 [Pirellulaceae bacterium]|nr:hypothetical protein [Pirellulaceae bacterium]